MAWVKLDDGFAEHDKVTALSDLAFRIHVTVLCYCSRRMTDGEVKAGQLRTWRVPPKVVRELLAADLWHESANGDGYVVNDYLRYNPSKEEILERRRKTADRVAAHRDGKVTPLHAV